MSSYIKDNELIALIEPLLKVKNSSFVTIEKPVPDKIKDSEHSKKNLSELTQKLRITQRSQKENQLKLMNTKNLNLVRKT